MPRKPSPPSPPVSEDARRETRAYEAYVEIRRRIVELELRPGVAFSEGELATELGLSKTPVREALLLLGAEGLVFPRPGAGYRVAAVTLKDVRSICAHRKLLEVAAVERSAVVGLDGRMASYLTDLLEGDENLPLALSRNAMFHTMLSRQDDDLTRDLSRALVKVDRVVRLAFGTVPPDNLREHRELLRAVLDGDPKTAGALAAEHADATERALLDALLSSDAVDQMRLG